jgi:hypothetical protein
LRVGSHGATGDGSAKRETKDTGLVPESHRSLEIVGCYCGVGLSFQLLRILTGRPVGALVGVSQLQAGSASKSDVAHHPSKDNGNHHKNVGPPGTERIPKTVSELQKNVVIHPTKEPAQHKFEGMSDPREESAQGMWKVARR